MLGSATVVQGTLGAQTSCVAGLSLARRLGWTAFALVALVACAKPVIAKDGTVVMQQQGASGTSVLTANGVEMRDPGDVPQRRVVRDPDEPWHAPIG